MRRREFVALLGCGAAAWPFAARGQKAGISVGFIHASTAERSRDVVAAFEAGLKQSGYAPGDTLTIEYRWANDDYDRLPQLAQGLVSARVAVILAATPVAALAAMHATGEIPIVFCVGSDPVKDGLVTNLSRPTGNITGTTFFGDLLSAKRLELLHELVPSSKVIGVLVNPKNPNADLEIRDARQAAEALALDLLVENSQSVSEIDRSFLRFGEERSMAGLLIASDAFLNLHGKEIAELALQYRLPTCFSYRQPVTAGGLMAYGADRPDAYRRAGNYVGRILRGAKAGDLPVEQPTKFEFVLNMRTAKALGLKVPASMQLLADQVIE